MEPANTCLASTPSSLSRPSDCPLPSRRMPRDVGRFTATCSFIWTRGCSASSRCLIKSCRCDHISPSDSCDSSVRSSAHSDLRTCRLCSDAQHIQRDSCASDLGYGRYTKCACANCEGAVGQIIGYTNRQHARCRIYPRNVTGRVRQRSGESSVYPGRRARIPYEYRWGSRSWRLPMGHRRLVRRRLQQNLV